VTIAGDEVCVDLAGSAGQVAAALNCPEPLSRSAIYAVLRRGMKAISQTTTVYSVRYTSRCQRHDREPVLTGGLQRSRVTSFRIIDTVQGALSGALPERLGASGDGGSTSFRMAARCPTARGSSPGHHASSTGGQQGADGIDGCAALQPT